MNRFALFPLLLLAGAAPPPPEPERPKLPAVPEREAVLLSAVLDFGVLVPAADVGRLQEAGFLLRPLRFGASEPEPKVFMVDEPEDSAVWMRTITRARGEIIQRAEAISRYLYLHTAERGEELRPYRSSLYDRADELQRQIQARHEAEKPPPTPKPPKPLTALSVRCPVRHCQAKPGERCRGHSGEAMDTIHPARERAARRKP